MRPSRASATSYARLLIVVPAMLSATCAPASFEAEPELTPPRAAGKPCPPVPSYTAEEQADAAEELALLRAEHDPCRLCLMMDGYRLMRRQCR